jgi:hypothetical protein
VARRSTTSFAFPDDHAHGTSAATQKVPWERAGHPGRAEDSVPEIGTPPTPAARSISVPNRGCDSLTVSSRSKTDPRAVFGGGFSRIEGALPRAERDGVAGAARWAAWTVSRSACSSLRLKG